MKKLLLFIIALTVYSFSNAASYISAANGDWSTVTTWTPYGVPQPGDDVTINHDVIMDDGYTVSGYWSIDAGTLTIGANGSLVQGTNVIGIAIQNGGAITNNGVFSFDQLGNYSGTFTNNGTANFYSLIYNLDGFNNSGIVQEVDSFYTSGIVNNYSNGTINSDSTYNAGTFTNEGALFFNYFVNEIEITNNGTITFFDFTNVGNFFNNNLITVNNDGLNLGMFWNKTSSEINLTRSFSNIDSVSHNALFINDGLFNIGDSWTNSDTTRGGSTGEFYIEEGTYNSGYMKGTFKFCDNTPTVSTPPIIDHNTGTIESGITYCAVGVEEINTENNFSIYPNPTKNNIQIVINSDKLNESAQIFDITGKIVKQVVINGTETEVITKDLQNGVYFIKIGVKTAKFIKK